MNKENYTFEMTIQNPNNPDCKADIYTGSRSDMINSEGSFVNEKDLTTRSGELYYGQTIALAEWKNDECMNPTLYDNAEKTGTAPEIHTVPASIDFVSQQVKEAMSNCPFSSENGCILKDNHSIDS